MDAPIPPTPSQRAKVFEPFAKVWSPRTPDSSYDSFGITQPSPSDPIVMAPLIAEQMGAAATLEVGNYVSSIVGGNGNEAAGIGITLESGTYTSP
jgi:hypothetical protein